MKKDKKKTHKQQSKATKRHTHCFLPRCQVPCPLSPNLRPLISVCSSHLLASTYPLTSAKIKQPWPKINSRIPKTKDTTPQPISGEGLQCVLNQVWALPSWKGEERGRQSIPTLSLWYSQWSSLTPSSPPNWVMVGDGCVFFLCGDDEDEEEVVGF